jgi:hypothetical protein
MEEDKVAATGLSHLDAVTFRYGFKILKAPIPRIGAHPCE